MRILEHLPGDGPVNASTRWAIAAGPDGFLKLQLQGLPLVASVLNNRSTFKRYATPIQSVLKFSRNKTFGESALLFVRIRRLIDIHMIGTSPKAT
jgi:hypothetical protein